MIPFQVGGEHLLESSEIYMPSEVQHTQNSEDGQHKTDERQKTGVLKCNENIAQEIYQVIKQERVITFEGSEGSMPLKKAAKPKKSVTFSEKDWIYEFDQEKDSRLNDLALASQKKKTSKTLNVSDTNKENMYLDVKTEKPIRKMLNLKELQLNPKQFTGKRQQAAKHLKLINHSEASIESSIEPSKGQRADMTNTLLNESSKNQPNYQTLFKNIQLDAKLDGQVSVGMNSNKFHTQVYHEDRKEVFQKGLFSKAMGNGTDADHYQPPRIPSYHRNQESLILRSIDFNKSSKEKLDRREKIQLEKEGMMSSNREAIRYRSLSSQNLNSLKHQRSNIDFLNQLVNNKGKEADGFDRSQSTTRARFARSLSVTNRTGKNVSFASSHEPHSLVNNLELRGNTFKFEEERRKKQNLFESKLNFLSFNKQPVERKSNIQSSRNQDKPLIVDLSIYRKLMGKQSSRGMTTGGGNMSSKRTYLA